MKYQDNYEIELNIEGQWADFMSSAYSFIMRDSIYSLYPEVKFSLEDATGLYQEFLMSLEGVQYDIKFGIGEDFISCPYVVKGDSLPQGLNDGILSGNVDVDLTHRYYDQQTKISKYHYNRISAIVEDLAGDFPFNSVNVNGTGNEDAWYQPLVNDAEFMNDYLLPFAFSNNSDNSPFFLFIDSNNDFHFRNYKSLFEQNPVNTLLYANDNQETASKIGIQNLRRIRMGSTLTKKTRHREIYNFSDPETAPTFQEDFVYSYPSSSKNIPIIATDGPVTDYLEYHYDLETTGQKENQKGFLIQSNRNRFFLEQFTVTLPLNPSLRAGKTVELEVFTSLDAQRTDYSQAYSGKYLIEESNHIWEGSDSVGYTSLVLVRRELNVPSSSYKFKKKFIK